MRIQALAYVASTCVRPSELRSIASHRNKRNMDNCGSVIGVHDKSTQRCDRRNCGSMITAHGQCLQGMGKIRNSAMPVQLNRSGPIKREYNIAII
jgi:hypothetical protein